MSTTKTVSMTLAKATPEDFRIMWKVSKAHQDLAWAHNRQRERRLKMLIIGRLEQLGTGGFMRIVMGCESLIAECCDPKLDHLALKPIYGAAPQMLILLGDFLEELGGDSLTELQARALVASVNGDAR